VTTAIGPRSSRHFERDILALAKRNGFRLDHYETETGQLVWEWQRGDEPKPQFVSRRVALHWMADWLQRS
jgi:hypothetical protein